MAYEHKGRIFQISINFPYNSVCDLFLALTHTLDQKRGAQSAADTGCNNCLFNILSGISGFVFYLFNLSPWESNI